MELEVELQNAEKRNIFKRETSERRKSSTGIYYYKPPYLTVGFLMISYIKWRQYYIFDRSRGRNGR